MKSPDVDRRGLRRRLGLFLAVGLSVAAWSGEPPPERSVDHGSYDAILRATVKGEGVDYAQIRDRYRGELDNYLARLARVDIEALTRDQQLALYFNLYNATMIRAVVDRYSTTYSPSDGEFAVFDLALVRLKTGEASLNRLEHEIIRPRFKDPRVHVALVCAARSCPPLLARAYTSTDLDELLEQNMRRFVNDRSRNEIDVAARQLRLSRIFEWYAEDFGGRDRLAAYVDRFTDADVSGFTVEFLPYSWELNDSSAPSSSSS